MTRKKGIPRKDGSGKGGRTNKGAWGDVEQQRKLAKVVVREVGVVVKGNKMSYKIMCWK